MIKLYGFYNGAGKLITTVPKRNIEDAVKWFKTTYPDGEYMYIEVLYGENV